MTGLPKQSYTQEFREQAVKSVLEGGLTMPETARRLKISSLIAAFFLAIRFLGFFDAQPDLSII